MDKERSKKLYQEARWIADRETLANEALCHIEEDLENERDICDFFKGLKIKKEESYMKSEKEFEKWEESNNQITPSLVGKEVIVDKGGVKENFTYKVRVENGVQEFTRSNVIGLSKETENVEGLEEKSPSKYISYYTISSLLEMLNMKGFERFSIITQVGGYEYKDSVKLISKRLDNSVSIGDEIYAMDFMVKILEQEG
jgi:hypothetical protein